MTATFCAISCIEPLNTCTVILHLVLPYLSIPALRPGGDIRIWQFTSHDCRRRTCRAAYPARALLLLVGRKRQSASDEQTQGEIHGKEESIQGVVGPL